MFEAAHFGVPVLALPLSGDQYQNAAKVYDSICQQAQCIFHGLLNIDDCLNNDCCTPAVGFYIYNVFHYCVASAH